MEALAGAYLWIVAAHVIFVIFWMEGLFMLPRYLVYHQEGLNDPAEAARWVERETKLRRIILTPAMVIVWVLGIALALNAGIADGVPGLGWLHAKILIVGKDGVRVLGKGDFSAKLNFTPSSFYLRKF